MTLSPDERQIILKALVTYRDSLDSFIASMPITSVQAREKAMNEIRTVVGLFDTIAKDGGYKEVIR